MSYSRTLNRNNSYYRQTLEQLALSLKELLYFVYLEKIEHKDNSGSYRREVLKNPELEKLRWYS